MNRDKITTSMHVQGVHMGEMTLEESKRITELIDWLREFDEIGMKKAARIVKKFDTKEAILQASRAEISSIEGFGELATDQFLDQLNELYRGRTHP